SVLSTSAGPLRPVQPVVGPGLRGPFHSRPVPGIRRSRLDRHRPAQDSQQLRCRGATAKSVRPDHDLRVDRDLAGTRFTRGRGRSIARRTVRARAGHRFSRPCREWSPNGSGGRAPHRESARIERRIRADRARGGGKEMTEIILIMVGVLLAFAAGASVFRIVKGPAILDRMIASDMLVTTLILVLGTEMAVHAHTRTTPIMVVPAAPTELVATSSAHYASKHGAGRLSMPGVR